MMRSSYSDNYHLRPQSSKTTWLLWLYCLQEMTCIFLEWNTYRMWPLTGWKRGLKWYLPLWYGFLDCWPLLYVIHIVSICSSKHHCGIEQTLNNVPLQGNHGNTWQYGQVPDHSLYLSYLASAWPFWGHFLWLLTIQYNYIMIFKINFKFRMYFLFVACLDFYTLYINALYTLIYIHNGQTQFFYTTWK